MNTFSKNFLFGALIAIFLITTIIFGVLWMRTKQELRITNQEVGDLQKQIQEVDKGLVSGWSEYRKDIDDFDGFTFLYPKNWVLRPAVYDDDEIYSPEMEYFDHEVLELFTPETYAIRREEERAEIDEYTGADLVISVARNQQNLPFKEWYKRFIVPLFGGFEVMDTFRSLKLISGPPAYFIQQPGLGDCCETVYVVPSTNKFFINFSANSFSPRDNLIKRAILESLQIDTYPYNDQ